MAGTLYAQTTIYVDGKKYSLDTVPGTTKLYEKTIPVPHRRRIDSAIRTIVASLRELDQDDDG